MQQVILALDVGSSSVRCSAYRIVDTVEALNACCTQQKIRSVQPNTGKIILSGEREQTGESYSLLDEIDACVDMTLQALRQEYANEPFQVVGLGFSTFVMNLVGVDSRGSVVGQEATLSYACNSPQVATECRILRRDLGEERLKDLYQKTGAPLHSAYALAQLRALYSDAESPAKRVHRWQTIASLCLARWQGIPFAPISYSEASWTGLLNFKTCEWEQDATSLLPLECQEALPSLADYCDMTVCITECINGTTNENPYWERWPELRESCRLFLGLGDGACANIGSKCSTPRRIAVTVGTSAAGRVVLPLPCTKDKENTEDGFCVPPGLFCYRVDRSHVLVGGALTDGGSVVEWASSLLNLKSDDAFQACMEQVETIMLNESESSSLTVVPFLSGERSTGYRDGATGIVLGLTRETTPAHFMKACMEGVMLRMKAILNLVCQAIEEQTDCEDEKPYIVVSGNAMEKSALWRQMLADASGMEVQLDSSITEGTSRGVARLVSISLTTKCQDEETTGTLMVDEPISSPAVSSPRRGMIDGYWAKAAEDQECFIDAVSPLW